MTEYATREDLILLQRLALSPSTGPLATRNAVMRCARTVMRALRSEDDTQEIPIVKDPYQDPRGSGPTIKRPDPIL